MKNDVYEATLSLLGISGVYVPLLKQALQKIEHEFLVNVCVVLIVSVTIVILVKHCTQKSGGAINVRVVPIWAVVSVFGAICCVLLLL